VIGRQEGGQGSIAFGCAVASMAKAKRCSGDRFLDGQYFSPRRGTLPRRVTGPDDHQGKMRTTSPKFIVICVRNYFPEFLVLAIPVGVSQRGRRLARIRNLFPFAGEDFES